MVIKFVSIDTTLILFTLVNCYSFSILTDLTQCISYRFVPCPNGMIENVKTFIDTNEEVIKFNKTDCISYQFLPCRDGWKSLTIVYQNSSKNEKQTNCLANGDLENSAKESAKTLKEKNYCEANLTICQNGRNLCETNLTNCNKEIFNCSTEKSFCQEIFADCQHKEADFEERYHKVVKEKKFLSAYMATFFTGKSFNEEGEKNKIPKERLLEYIGYSAARLGLSELEPPNTKQLMPELGPVYNDIFSFNYPITIPAYAEQPKPLPEPEESPEFSSLFVAVTGLASENNRKKRDQIRMEFQNYINQPKKENDKVTWVKFAFFLGRTEDANIQKQIEEESRTNGDIVQIDLIDSVGNSSLKLAAVMNWVRLNCPNVHIFFKLDENYEYMNYTLTTVTKHFSGREKDLNIIYGMFGKSSVSEGGKRKISEEEFPWKEFPKYAVGPNFYIPGKMIFRFMAAFQTMPMISLADVYLGLCALKADIPFFAYCLKTVTGNKCF